jgi:tetratricopeptide (TPR) repeat protein
LNLFYFQKDMETYYTIEEKYLQAVEEYQYGESPKSLHLLNEIIASDPLYARAYFQLGLIYYYELKDYQQAGYCFKTCNELEPAFPDVYEHYLHLLAYLNMEKGLNAVKEKALQTPGVDHAIVLNLLGQFAERNKNLLQARQYYQQAFAVVTVNSEMDEIEESLKRVEAKQERSSIYRYSIS